MGGVDLFRVKELLGHADISTTMRYAHLAPKVFRDDLERVFGSVRSDAGIHAQNGGAPVGSPPEFYHSSTESCRTVQNPAQPARRRLCGLLLASVRVR